MAKAKQGRPQDSHLSLCLPRLLLLFALALLPRIGLTLDAARVDGPLPEGGSPLLSDLPQMMEL
ncbi:MAG: hypothetical protein WA417_07825 [Stellaceae bacterium]